MKTILLIVSVLSMNASYAQDDVAEPQAATPSAAAPAKTGTKKIIYKDTTIDFEGLSLEGELKAPGEFYFQNRNQERFDSLSKRRLNFRREMLRDAVQSN